ncbi:MAG: pilin, partial [Parcubacteria group bacterium]
MEFTTIAEASPGLTSCSAQGGTCCGAGKNCTGPTYNTNGSDCPTAECCQNAANCPAGPGPEPGPGPDPGPEPNIQQCLDSTIDTNSLKTYQVGDREVAYDGLVPCGKCVLVGAPGVDVVDENSDWVGDATATNVPCQLCHFFIMIKGISDFILFQLVPVVAVLLFTVGGIMYIVAKGDPSKLTQAKSIMTAVVFGLVIVFVSWLVINTIFVFTGLINPDFGWDPGKWFEINCSIVLPAP